MTGVPLNDATGGFKCYRIDVLKAINLGRVNPSNGYAFQIEMSYKAWRKGIPPGGESPSCSWTVTPEGQRCPNRSVYEAFFMVWKLLFRQPDRRCKTPMDVSVIIVNYNVRQFLENALTSILRALDGIAGKSSSWTTRRTMGARRW